MHAIASPQTPLAVSGFTPEYEGPEGIARRFGIGRSTVFELLRLGRIKSLSLKTHAGNVRGRRLVNIASVRGYLESLAQ